MQVYYSGEMEYWTWAADFTWVALNIELGKKSTAVLFGFGDARHRHNCPQSKGYDPWVVPNSRLQSQLLLTAAPGPIQCGVPRISEPGGWAACGILAFCTWLWDGVLHTMDFAHHEGLIILDPPLDFGTAALPRQRARK